ncbi:MAG: FAD:protein FMN transferase [Dehalococcoidia bacterium]|nr:FAD:protein FMN transferase [Dehalococcoidia bacterium]
MTTHEFRAMNTEWWITSDRGDLAEAEALVRDAERRLSRFLPDSALSRLNGDRTATDPWLAEVTRRALAAHEQTGGAFDIRVADALVSAGYDRTFELIEAHPASLTLAPRPEVPCLDIGVEGDTVTLHGAGTVDLGGIAKGWTVDRVGAWLTGTGATCWLVDGGGDIRAAGQMEDGAPWIVGVGDGLAVRLEDAAVCTSSTGKRRWTRNAGEAHHIINPASGRPATGAVTTAVVLATDTVTADILATAVIAQPARGLAAVNGAGGKAMVEHHGCWEMTPGMDRWIA